MKLNTRKKNLIIILPFVVQKANNNKINNKWHFIKHIEVTESHHSLDLEYNCCKLMYSSNDRAHSSSINI